MLKKYKEDFLIRSYEVDFMNQLFPSSMFDYLQQVATNHAKELGFGHKDLLDKGQYWVLARNYLKIENFPKHDEKLKVTTWPKGTTGLMALRDYIITNEKDEIVAKATSSWVLMDLNKHRPLRPPVSIAEGIKDDAVEELPPKIKSPKELETSHIHTVGYSDCDMNGHVNNVNYVRWMQNAFDKEYYEQHKVQEVAVNFLCECSMGQRIDIMKQEISPNTWYIEGHNTTLNEKAFKGTIYFQPVSFLED